MFRIVNVNTKMAMSCIIHRFEACAIGLQARDTIFAAFCFKEKGRKECCKCFSTCSQSCSEFQFLNAFDVVHCSIASQQQTTLRKTTRGSINSIFTFSVLLQDCSTRVLGLFALSELCRKQLSQVHPLKPFKSVSNASKA